MKVKGRERVHLKTREQSSSALAQQVKTSSAWVRRRMLSAPEVAAAVLEACLEGDSRQGESGARGTGTQAKQLGGSVRGFGLLRGQVT